MPAVTVSAVFLSSSFGFLSVSDSAKDTSLTG